MPSKRVSMKGKGADLFFGDYTPAETESSPIPALQETTPEINASLEDDSSTEADPQASGPLPSSATASPSRKRPQTPSPTKLTAKTVHDSNASEQPISQSSLLASENASKQARLTNIRRRIKVPGKEVVYVRVTLEEKQQLGDIVYGQKRRGRKTSETEIARIAISAMLLEYEESGDASLLARLLASLDD